MSRPERSRYNLRFMIGGSFTTTAPAAAIGQRHFSHPSKEFFTNHCRCKFDVFTARVFYSGAFQAQWIKPIVSL